MRYLPKESDALQFATGKYLQYDSYAPPPPSMSTATDITNTGKTCKQLCDEDSSCKHVYEYSKNDNRNYCLKNSESQMPKTFIPIQPSSGILNSKLYIKETKMNLLPNDLRSIPKKQNITEYVPYDSYEIVTTPFIKSNINQDIDASVYDALLKQKQYFNGKEGFDNHGYVDSNTVKATYGNSPQSTGLPDAIINNQIKPMVKITDDYSKSLNKVGQNFLDLSNNISKISNRANTGIRDVMLKNDLLYEYKNFDVNKRKTLNDGLLEDNKKMIMEQNALYILGLITSATLLVGAIVFARE
jgi:hypothetical protein